MKIKPGKLNSRAAINTIKLESLPYYYFSGNADIVPFGIDNQYPFRIKEAIRKSPTAQGCVKRQSEFIMGNGFIQTGDVVVNRDGETLNDILWQVIKNGYCTYYGFGLHLNFNSLGEICEIFAVDLEYVRKHRNLKAVEYGIFREDGNYFSNFHNITIDLYDRSTLYDKMRLSGVTDYRGQLYYYSKDADIYPTAPIDSSVISASYEREAQIYPYANIKNGFSGNTIIKYPTIAMGEEAKEESKEVQENIKRMHGAEHAGSSVVIPTSVGSDGKANEFKMVEHLSPTNVDGLFVNQNKKAENDILKIFNMPKILLGISDSGMFNEASFNDAFNYKNSDVEIDRKSIEREFNKILKHSIWSNIGKVQLQPLEMRQQKNAGQANF